MAENEKIEKLLQDLGRAIAEAMASSVGVSSALQRFHRQDFSIYLVLDGQDRDHCLQLEVSAVETPSLPSGSSIESAREPEFRLDGRDVAWLQSLGIDATRSGKRRRSR